MAQGASASAVRSVFSRWSTSTLFSVTPFFQNTPAPLEKSWRAAVTQNGSTVTMRLGSGPGWQLAADAASASASLTVLDYDVARRCRRPT